MNRFSNLLIAFAAVFWGLTGVFSIKFTQWGFSPYEMGFLRTLFATVIITILAFIKDKNVFKLHKLSDLAYFVIMGVPGFCGFNVAYTIAINETSMGVAGALFYTFPAFVTVFSIFLFNEKLNARKLFALIVTLLGCVLVTGAFETGGIIYSQKGILCGVFSGFAFAVYSVVSKLALKKYSIATATIYTFLMASIALGFMTNTVTAFQKMVEGNAVLWMLLFAFVISILPHLAYLTGLQKTEAGLASIIATIEPVVAAILGVFLFGESITWAKILGIGLICGVILILNLKKPIGDKEDKKQKESTDA